MKNLSALLLVVVLLFSFSSCSDNDNAESTDKIYDFSSTSADDVITTVIPPEEKDLSPLELLGDYYVHEEGFIVINNDKIKVSDDYDLYREYFFGAWNGDGIHLSGNQPDPLIIDDSEQSFLMVQRDCRFVYFYEVTDRVLAFVYGSSGGGMMYWLDTDEPDIMYSVCGSFSGLVSDLNGVYNINTLTKTAAPPNEPEDGFLSIFRLREISRDYGIELDMLVDIEYENEGGIERLHHDDWAHFYPVYLVSEAADKFALKTIVGNVYAPSEEVGVTYTIEKIGGEWIRTLEFDG